MMNKCNECEFNDMDYSCRECYQCTHNPRVKDNFKPKEPSYEIIHDGSHDLDMSNAESDMKQYKIASKIYKAMSKGYEVQVYLEGTGDDKWHKYIAFDEVYVDAEYRKVCNDI